MSRVILRTERLVLREFTEEDAEAIYRINSDSEVTRYTHDSFTSVEQALAILRSAPLADYQKHGYGRWACLLGEELIGFCGLKYLEDLHEVDLGYRFLRRCWGAGLATESARAVVAHGEDVLGITRIIGLVDPENNASVRVLQKVGMVFEEMIEYHGRATARYARHRAATPPAAGA
jgi:RimJ/RimL family protein N-acetyltransferase